MRADPPIVMMMLTLARARRRVWTTRTIAV
jgi:hypothetical protein